MRMLRPPLLSQRPEPGRLPAAPGAAGAGSYTSKSFSRDPSTGVRSRIMSVSCRLPLRPPMRTAPTRRLPRKNRRRYDLVSQSTRLTDSRSGRLSGVRPTTLKVELNRVLLYVGTSSYVSGEPSMPAAAILAVGDALAHVPRRL